MYARNPTALAALALSLLWAAGAVGAEPEKPAKASKSGKKKPSAHVPPKEGHPALPEGHPAMPGEPAPEGPLEVATPPAGSGSGSTALEWTAPDTWVAVTPASPMRKAQYKVPGPAGDAEMVVFYFGPREGGGAIANAQRWAGQFTLPDGKRDPNVVKLAQRKIGVLDVVTVETKGTYTGDMMSPGTRPDHALLGAIAQGPDANWFFKLVGPIGTVEAHRAAFEKLLGSLRPGK